MLAVAAMLLTLALPALQHARQAAERVRCENNLRTIGVGVQAFAAANDQMLPHNQLSAPHGSWNTQLLPFIGKMKLAREYNPGHDWWTGTNSPNRAVAGTRIPTIQCPAAPHPDRFVLTTDSDADGKSFNAAPTDYVGSAGAYYQDNHSRTCIPVRCTIALWSNGSECRTSSTALRTRCSLSRWPTNPIPGKPENLPTIVRTSRSRRPSMVNGRLQTGIICDLTRPMEKLRSAPAR